MYCVFMKIGDLSSEDILLELVTISNNEESIFYYLDKKKEKQIKKKYKIKV